MALRFRWLLVVAAIFGAAFFAVPALAAPVPANDNFGSAIPLAGSSGSTSGTTVGATDQAAEPGGGSLGIWYSWTPAVSGATIFQTCGGAGFDTWVDVFTGSSLGSLNLVVAADGGCSAGSKDSLGAFRANAGTKYWIRVGGFNGQQGAFTLSWNVQVNDDIGTAQVVSGHSVSVSGSTLGATDEPGEPATSSGGLWYSWTAPGAGNVTFDTCAGAEFDTVLDGYSGMSIATLSQVAHNDDSCGPNGRQSTITFATTAGTTYSVRVSGSPGTSPNGGQFTLSWSYTGPDSTPVTGTSLCLLTAQYVRGSARYQSLGVTPVQQAQVDALVNATCDALGKWIPRLSPLQKALVVTLYKSFVTSLAANNWLTAAQKTTLFTMAGQL
jgi:hypothetical protein